MRPEIAFQIVLLLRKTGNTIYPCNFETASEALSKDKILSWAC